MKFQPIDFDYMNELIFDFIISKSIFLDFVKEGRQKHNENATTTSLGVNMCLKIYFY